MEQLVQKGLNSAMNMGKEIGNDFEFFMSKDNFVVIQKRSETGEGVMAMYEVMSGIQIMFNDFNLSELKSNFSSDKELFCIDHCREGLIEQEIVPDTINYISAGDLRIDDRKNHKLTIKIQTRAHTPPTAYTITQSKLPTRPRLIQTKQNITCNLLKMLCHG